MWTFSCLDSWFVLYTKKFRQLLIIYAVFILQTEFKMGIQQEQPVQIVTEDIFSQEFRFRSKLSNGSQIGI